MKYGTENEQRPRVALVGYGRWGKHVARDLSGCGAAVIAVCRSDASAERARSAAEVEEVERSIADAREVDGVVVCSPTSTHAEAIESAAALEVPIFVEKPLTNDVESARRLVSAFGNRIFVMDKWRYHPGVERIGEIVRSREFGPAAGLITRRVGSGIAHDDVDAAWVLAPHELAIGLEVLGQRLEPRAAVASFGGNGIEHLSAILGSDPWQSLEISAVATAHHRAIDLICREATVSLPNPYADHLAILDREHPEKPVGQIAISTELPLLREVRAFVDYLRGTGPPPKSSAAEALWNVETVQRLRELAGAGR